MRFKTRKTPPNIHDVCTEMRDKIKGKQTYIHSESGVIKSHHRKGTLKETVSPSHSTIVCSTILQLVLEVMSCQVYIIPNAHRFSAYVWSNAAARYERSVCVECIVFFSAKFLQTFRTEVILIPQAEIKQYHIRFYLYKNLSLPSWCLLMNWYFCFSIHVHDNMYLVTRGRHCLLYI